MLHSILRNILNEEKKTRISEKMIQSKENKCFPLFQVIIFESIYQFLCVVPTQKEITEKIHQENLNYSAYKQ